MTFLERYQAEPTWYGRAIIMELYHLAQSIRRKEWTIKRTAQHFQCSIGLVSENLRLAEAIRKNERLMNLPSRQEALKRIN